MLPNSIEAVDAAYQLHSYSNPENIEQDGPLVIVEGEGVYVIDNRGKRYLEGMAGLWSASLGFSNKRLVEAAVRQLTTLPFYHTFFGRTPAVTALLSEALVKITPARLTRCFFANSGSEANDTAIKLVWYFNNALGRPAKKKIISRINAYHGVTIAAASLTYIPVNQRSFDLPIAGFLQTDCPHYYRGGRPGETEEQFATRLTRQLEELILAENPETIAAFIAEPVMAAGGVIVPPIGYFEKIQAVLKKYDILLIADEVVCGFGRTGNMFGSETYSLVPDMMVMAKGLSASYQPISALMITDEIYEAIKRESGRIGMFGHGFTYSGHPVPAAVALEALKIYEEERILDRVRESSPRFQSRLKSLMDHPLIGEARGIGLIGAVEIVADKKSKEPFSPTCGAGQWVFRKALDLGLIVRPRGDTLTLCPPLIISHTEIDELFSKLAQALDEAAAALGA